MSTKTMTNEEALRKALISAADSLASAGEVTPAEAEKFLDYVVDETSLKANARIVRIPKGDKWRVNKIGVGTRNAVLATEGVDPGIRRGITTGAVNLETVEIMLPFDIGDGFLERNIEGMSAREHVVRMMAAAFSNDTEELLLNGNVLGPARIENDLIPGGSATGYIKDSFIGGLDGLLRLADGGNVVDVEGANFGVTVARQAVTALPTKFRRNRGDLRLMTPIDILELWRERQSSRGTALGDQTLGGGPGVKPFGLVPAEMALLQMNPRVVQHVTLSQSMPTQLAYTGISNVVVTPVTLGSTPTAAYAAYVVDTAAGTIMASSGALDATDVKVTYETSPQLILTHKSNIIIGISRDVRLERDRNIHRRVSEFVITCKVGMAIENLDAVVKLINVGEGV